MDRIKRYLTGYSTSHEIEREMRTVGGRGVIMPMSISYDPRTVVVREPTWGETLEDFYKIHNQTRSAENILTSLDRK